jgi:hypothetical protein
LSAGNFLVRNRQNKSFAGVFYLKQTVMDPFNIIIRVENKQIDLNIHPQEASSFKVIYHGALLGEVFMSKAGWEAVTADELQPGGFPVYEYDETSGHEDILLNNEIIQAIGQAISEQTNIPAR